jgi:hypothetical protein
LALNQPSVSIGDFDHYYTSRYQITTPTGVCQDLNYR